MEIPQGLHIGLNIVPEPSKVVFIPIDLWQTLKVGFRLGHGVQFIGEAARRKSSSSSRARNRMTFWKSLNVTSLPSSR